MKIGYFDAADYESKAYLDEEIAPGVWTGTHKHTDDPLRVRWDEATERWLLIDEAGNRTRR